MAGNPFPIPKALKWGAIKGPKGKHSQAQTRSTRLGLQGEGFTLPSTRASSGLFCPHAMGQPMSPLPPELSQW